MRAADLSEFGDRLDRADLVVGEHYRHERGVVAQCRFKLLGTHDPVFVNGQKRDLEPAFFELVQSMQNRVMFYRARYYVLFALALADRSRRNYRLIVRLAAARCEIYLVRLAVERCRYIRACACERVLGKLPGGVQARRIGVAAVEVRQHRFYRRFRHFRRCRVVCVNFHVSLRK